MRLFDNSSKVSDTILVRLKSLQLLLTTAATLSTLMNNLKSSFKLACNLIATTTMNVLTLNSKLGRQSIHDGGKLVVFGLSQSR